MKKTILSMIMAGIAALTFTGCTAGDEPDDFYADQETFYVVDASGSPIQGIAWNCNEYLGHTDDFGSLRINSAEMVCELSLDGRTEPIFIYDYQGPVEGLNYDCTPSGIADVTDVTGMIDFVEGDTCTIWLDGVLQG